MPAYEKISYLIDTIVKPELISYQGMITGRLGDGILELDDNVRLYFFHYNFAQRERCFRIGTKIRVNNVHLIVENFSPQQNLIRSKSNTKNKFERKIFQSLVCCAYSSIHIDKFSEFDIEPMYLKQRKSAQKKLWRKYSIPVWQKIESLVTSITSLTDLLEGDSTTKTKLYDLASAIVSQLTPLDLSCTFDIYKQFFDHDGCCNVW